MIKRKKICYCLLNNEKIWGLEFVENCQLIYIYIYISLSLIAKLLALIATFAC